MVKILHDVASKELVSSSRSRIVSMSEARGEEEQVPELSPPLNKVGGPMPSVAPKRVKLIFANKKERDIMYQEELEHLQEATAGR